MKRYLFFALFCSFIGLGTTLQISARTIEFETTEVTNADVALSPDGEMLIFTMLGHLFRLPVMGGRAHQLTFGPYYDSNPVFSPDGTRVAFVSDRDGSESNIFLLELTTGRITQVTRETRAIRPTWTPDGRAIVYLRPVREAAHYRSSIWGPLPSLVRRVSLDGGEPETLSGPPREIRSLFYLGDGRLGWTALEREPNSVRASTRIEVMSEQGQTSTLRTVDGIVDRVMASAGGEGLFCRRIIPIERNVQREHLLYLPLHKGPVREIMNVTGSGRGWGTGRWHWAPVFAVSPDEASVYVGNAGRLWRADNPRGARISLDFHARVWLEIQDPGTPNKWSPPPAGGVATPQISTPALPPDGQSLVFRAAGYLWRQRLEGGSAERLFEGTGFEGGPCFSPDGERLIYAYFDNEKDEIRIYDFENGSTRKLDPSGDPMWFAWSPDGSQVAFLLDGEELQLLDVASGEIRTLLSGFFHPHLTWGPDSERLFFCDHDEDENHRFVGLNVRTGEREVIATGLPPDTNDVRLGPSGERIFFSTQCRLEIWSALLDEDSSIRDGVERVSDEGGNAYTFTPDGSSLLYAFAGRLWRVPLDGGNPDEIPLGLELRRPTPPPMLVKRVRPMDFASGGFGPETSIYIEQERIQWIGPEDGRSIPSETVKLDARGRFAIPGFFDMHFHGGNPEAYIAYGVTSARDVGASLLWMNTLADRSEVTSEAMPRYFHGGDPFCGPQLMGGARIYDEDDARDCTRSWGRRGALHIKSYASLSWPNHRIIAEEARVPGLPIIAHGEALEEATKAAILGYWSLEHIGTRERFYGDALQMIALAGMRWCPTLGNQGHSEWMLREEPGRIISPKFRAFHSDSFIRDVFRESPFVAVNNRALLGFVTEGRAGVRAAYDRGVHLLTGSHAVAGAFPGTSLHWEIEHFVKAGIDPLDALRIATLEGAMAVGAERDLGTLEAGKLADIVLLDADPLEEIKNTQTIWRVIKGGWVYDPEQLQPHVSSTDIQN